LASATFCSACLTFYSDATLTVLALLKAFCFFISAFTNLFFSSSEGAFFFKSSFYFYLAA